MEEVSTEDKARGILKLLGRDSHLESAELAKALRGMDLNPSESQLAALQSEAVVDQNNCIELSEFLRLHAKCQESSYSAAQVRQQFQLLAKGEGHYVELDELKELLQQGEEPLSEQQIEEFLADFASNDGRYNVEEMLETLLAPVKRTVT